jgi:uncharacterized glyoxalase superfamily protein PhnB
MNDTQPPKPVWPTLNYADAPAAIRFLVDVLGFEERTVHTSEDDETFVEHAELRWPEGGGVMLGTADPDGNPFKRIPTGIASNYVVTDDPDAVFARIEAAGAEVVREMRDEDYGSRGFTARDPEGNLWSFGTYRGT